MNDTLMIVNGPWPGRLGILGRPRGGDWLEDEVAEWARLGIDVVVSLLTPGEIGEFELATEAAQCRANGIEFFGLPIPDRSVPPAHDAVLALCEQLDNRLANAKTVAIHCRQGIGRSGVLIACLLVSNGVSPDEAFNRLSEARGRPIPESDEQRHWVEAFAPQLIKHEL